MFFKICTTSIFMEIFGITHNYLFSVVDDVNGSTKLNNDLIRIQEWFYQWKMSFNPGRTRNHFLSKN